MKHILNHIRKAMAKATMPPIVLAEHGDGELVAVATHFNTVDQLALHQFLVYYAIAHQCVSFTFAVETTLVIDTPIARKRRESEIRVIQLARYTRTGCQEECRIVLRPEGAEVRFSDPMGFQALDLSGWQNMFTVGPFTPEQRQEALVRAASLTV